MFVGCGLEGAFVTVVWCDRSCRFVIISVCDRPQPHAHPLLEHIYPTVYSPFSLIPLCCLPISPAPTPVPTHCLPISPSHLSFSSLPPTFRGVGEGAADGGTHVLGEGREGQCQLNATRLLLTPGVRG